jgi:trimethylamine--corrinoid protein Co-methyltransferase
VSLTSVVRPSLTVLNEEQIAQVHDGSLRILETVGIRVDSGPARQLFAQAIGPTMAAIGSTRSATHIAPDDRQIRIPRDLVEWAVQTAPPAVDVYDRLGNLAFRLPGQARFGIGVTALYYQDPMTDAVAPFTRQHMEAMVRLGSALPSFDAISTVGIVQDVPAEVSDLYATLEMVANTVKPLVLLVSDESAFPSVLDLLEHLHGDLAARPFVLPYFNPISPLIINEGTVDKMLWTIERGLPFLYSNYGMAGASTPITPAGTLTLLNAELLAGLVLSQLIKESAPVVLGSLPAYFDMKGMGSFYDAKSYLIDLACAEMMAHYQLPHCGTSGSGMGWGADVIASGHQWLNHLVSCLGKVGLAPFVGDNLDSKAFSPTIIVLADEIIAQARMLADGFALEDAALVLDEIAQAGPGGDFLTSDRTLKLFRQAYHHSAFFPKLTLEDWLARGCPRAEDLLRHHTQQMLQELAAPEDHGELMARGQAFIDRIAASRR